MASNFTSKFVLAIGTKTWAYLDNLIWTGFLTGVSSYNVIVRRMEIDFALTRTCKNIIYIDEYLKWSVTQVEMGNFLHRAVSSPVYN